MAEARGVPSLGGYDEEFVNAVEEDLHCAICQLPLKEAVQTGNCGHRFCRQCIDEHFRRLELNRQATQCPVDRNNLIPDKDIFPDRATQRKILSFVIKCPSEGCQWTGELRSKESHLAACPFKVVSCTNENCHVTLISNNLQEHVTTTCPWRILCCNHCSVSHPACKTEVHQNECRRFPLNCPQNCGAVIPREEVQEISSHVEKDCPLTIISCPYAQMGCTTKVQRREVESHLQATVRLHLDLACVKLNSMQVELSNTQVQLNDTQEKLKEIPKMFEENFNSAQREFKDTIRKLEEKFDSCQRAIKVQLNDTQEELKETTRKLEEKFKESTIKLEEKVKESNKLEEKLKESTIKLEEKVKESNKLEEKFKESTIKLEEKVDVLEKTMQYLNERNYYKWKISGFSEVLRKAKSEEKEEIESVPIYIYGYKCQLNLCPNGCDSGKNTHLSLYFLIMKGEYDATLPWPFHKKVTFTLIDQQENVNDRENIVKYFTTDPEEKECYARPVTDENSGYGCPEFVLHDKLKERRYIVDDTIFILVQLDPPEQA